MDTIEPLPTLVSWSSGKDSALALYRLQQHQIPVVGLFTTINSEFQRVAMHGVRLEILETQAQRLGLPLHIIQLPWPCTNKDYERRMAEFFSAQVSAGVRQLAFGDLFLEDVRGYRERQLQAVPLAPVFPLWRQDTISVAHALIDEGFRARLSCIDCQQLSADFAGREYTRDLLADLPANADPCGENGEFHTLIYDAPNFSAPITVTAGEIVMRDQFCYADFSLETQ